MADADQTYNVEESRSTSAVQPAPGGGSGGRGRMRKVTVEPVLFIHNMCTQIMWIGAQELQIEKACSVNVGLSDKICSDLSHHKADQSTVLDVVATLLMYRSILETSIKAVWLLMLWSWSDRYSRQLPLIISISGLGAEALVYLIISFLPSLPVESLLLASAPYSLSGGTHALLMICFTYLADTSKPGKRTFRMGLLDAAYYLGSPVGLALVSPLLDAGGYRAVYVFVMAVYAATIVYVVVTFHGERRKVKETNDQMTRKRQQCQESCDVSHLYQAVQVTVQPRPHHLTVYILLLILAMLFDTLPVWGEGNVKYLFTHEAMGWNHTQYSHWATFASLFSVCVMVVVVPLLSVVAQVPDGWLGVLGGVSHTAGSIIYGCVTSSGLSWLMWTGAVFGSGKNLAPVVIRSLLSKLSGSYQVGQVFAVLGMAETLVVLGAAPLYKAVYSATNDYRPATYNFLSAGFNILQTTILLGVTLQLKKVWSLLSVPSEEPSSQPPVRHPNSQASHTQN